MRDFRLTWLAAGCAVFAAIIAAELSAGNKTNIEATTVSAGGASAAVRPQAPRVSAERLTAAALARPLFSPTRRPPPTDGPSVEDLTDKRLAGIVILPGYRLAIFAVNGAKSIALTEGEMVNGWRIETITPHAVSLRGPTVTKTLQPKMNSAPAAQPQSSRHADKRPPAKAAAALRPLLRASRGGHDD